MRYLRGWSVRGGEGGFCLCMWWCGGRGMGDGDEWVMGEGEQGGVCLVDAWGFL